jgi:hypothetical protein
MDVSPEAFAATKKGYVPPSLPRFLLLLYMYVPAAPATAAVAAA